MRIVYMGTPQFAVPSLDALNEAGHEIILVVTQPDRRGNRNKIVMSPVKERATELDLEIAQPFKIRNDEEFKQELKELAPDMIVVAAFGQILPEDVLNIPKFGCINVHGSLLPKYRGASPMQAAIAAGDKTTGVTIMKMDVGLDTGDMISTVECDIEGRNIDEVAELLSEAGAKLLVDTIENIVKGTAVYTKQDDSIASITRQIKKSDGMTCFDEAADVIECRIRAYYDWPTVYSYLGDESVKFFKAEALIEETCDGEPGTVSEVDKECFIVNCKEGKLKILELQLQGKKRMKCSDFLRGRKLNKGDRFSLKEV